MKVGQSCSKIGCLVGFHRKGQAPHYHFSVSLSTWLWHCVDSIFPALNHLSQLLNNDPSSRYGFVLWAAGSSKLTSLAGILAPNPCVFASCFDRKLCTWQTRMERPQQTIAEMSLNPKLLATPILFVCLAHAPTQTCEWNGCPCRAI